MLSCGVEILANKGDSREKNMEMSWKLGFTPVHRLLRTLCI